MYENVKKFSCSVQRTVKSTEVGFDKIYYKSRVACSGWRYFWTRCGHRVGMQSRARRFAAKDVIESGRYLVSQRDPPS